MRSIWCDKKTKMTDKCLHLCIYLKKTAKCLHLCIYLRKNSSCKLYWLGYIIFLGFFRQVRGFIAFFFQKYCDRKQQENTMWNIEFKENIEINANINQIFNAKHLIWMKIKLINACICVFCMKNSCCSFSWFGCTVFSDFFAGWEGSFIFSLNTLKLKEIQK